MHGTEHRTFSLRITAWLAPLLFLLVAVAAPVVSAKTSNAWPNRVWENCVGTAQSRPIQMPQSLELQRENSIGRYNDASGCTLAAKSIPASESWGNAATLAKHFADHGADFGATGAEDYANQASQFLQRAQQEGLPTKIDSADGAIRVYDPQTNTFGAYNANGTTRTFFKPSGGVNYWNRQPGVAPTIIGGQ